MAFSSDGRSNISESFRLTNEESLFVRSSGATSSQAKRQVTGRKVRRSLRQLCLANFTQCPLG
jgi:hypothetical protein